MPIDTKTPVTFERFNLALGGAAERMSNFSNTLTSATRGITGFTESFRSLSRSTVGLGAGAAALGGPFGKMLGLPIAGLGAAGMLGGGIASAGLNMAGAAAPNGLQSVDKAFDILAGTIGSMLLPGVVALGGAALMAADGIQAFIDENMDSIIETWADAIETATKALQDFTEWAKAPVKNTANSALDFLDSLDRKTNKWGRSGGIGPPQEGVGPFAGLSPQQQAMLEKMEGGAADKQRFRDMMENRQLDFMPAGSGPGLAEGIFGKGGLGGHIKDIDKKTERAASLRELAANMRMITSDMQQSVLRPSLTDPVGKWKEVAMQIQNSELEMKKLDMQQKAIDATNRLADRLEKKADALDPPAQQGGAFIGGRLRIGR